MRILHVLDSLDPRYGGPVRAVVDLSERAREHGLETEFAGFGRAVPRAPTNNTHCFQTSGPSSYRYAPNWRPWLKANLQRFDGVVLHSAWLYWGWAASQECIRARVPYACFPHGMIEPWSVRGQGWVKRLKKTLYWSLRERNIIAGSRCLLFTTERERRLAEQTFRLPSVPKEVIPYGAETGTGSLPDRAPSKLATLAGRKFALFLGRIHPKKNPDLLLRAWATAQPENCILVFAGPTQEDYSRHLKTLADDLKLNERVRFVDFVDGADKSWLFSNAMWFFLPSSQENFGVAALEALRYGCPVVLSDQVAIAEEMPQDTPILPVDVTSWARFFTTRLNDEHYRQGVKTSQFRFARERWDIERLAAGWSATLKSAFAS